MEQIINFNEAQKAAENFGKNIQDKQVSVFESILSQASEVNPELGGIEELGALLALSDEDFQIVAPIFLVELEKAFNNVNDKLSLAYAMNLNGTKLEDIKDAYEKLILAIDNEFAETLSAPKRDFLKRMFSITCNAIVDIEGTAKRIIQVPIELVSENAKIPTYANTGDAAVDLYSPIDFTLGPGETKIIPVDIKVALPYGYAFLIHPRSGLSAKTKMRITNSIGLIDSQYKGNIGVIVENIDPKIKDIDYSFDENGKIVINSIEHGKSISFSKGDRFAQMRLVEVPNASFFQVNNIEEHGANRGGGFGSSGIN